MKPAALAALTALLLSPPAVTAQMSPGARSVGMGGGGMVFATGVDAIEWNPANLARGDRWNVSVFELGLASLSTGATFDEILAIFGAEFIASGVDVAQAVNDIPDSGLHLSTVSEGFATAFAADRLEIPKPGSPLPSVGLAVGPVGVRIRSRVFTDLTMSRELADLIGNGFVEENILDYRVGDTGWSTTSLTELTVAYGRTVGDILSVGVGGRWVRGNGMVRGRFFEPTVDLVSTSLTIETAAVEATSGTGYGLDIGLSLDLPGGLRASASGANVVQRMTWNDALIAHTATFTDADFDAVEVIDLLDRFEAEAVDPTSVSLAVFQAAQGLFEQSYFPQVFRGGVGWRSGGTSLEAVGIAVSPRGRYTTGWDERVSLGIEQRLPVITLRAGYAKGQDGFTVLTGGLGLGIGPVLLEASVGKFGGDDVGVSRDGYHGTFALQLEGGGS